MATACSENGCKGQVPHALESPHLCVLHFTLQIEKACAEMRRETVYGENRPTRGRLRLSASSRSMGKCWRARRPAACTWPMK